MSKGNPILKARLPARVIQEVEATIARRNLYSREEPWTVSDFVRIALVEKLKKMERCRRQGGGRRRPPAIEAEDWVAHVFARREIVEPAQS